MFYLNKDTPLTQALLQKMINCFRITVEPRLTNYKNYYDGLQAILNKAYSDPTKPCNRTVINYCKNIVDSYCGYMAAPNCISYYSDADIDDIMSILRYNDYQAEDSELLLNALIYGVACELMYIDSESNTRFRIIDPTTCFGVYDDSLTSDLMYFVRIYKVNEWDNNNQYCVDVYDSNTVKHYTMVGENSFLTFNGEEPHYFGQCPANIFVMPDEKSIFDCILTLQDTVNELLSAEVDDYSAFCDAYLTLEGVDADSTDIASMKENRVLLLPVGAKATWLTKTANDAQVENILKRVHDSIYRISACVDFSSETFTGGVSSGIAQFAEACATLIGLPLNIDDSAGNSFDTLYPDGANFEGSETIRYALNAIAEATQTIYYISDNLDLTFKRLSMTGDPVYTIDKSKYFKLDSKAPCKLTKIVSTNELGDAISSSTGEDGVTQYVRDNPFWELRNDRAELVDKAIEAVGGLTLVPVSYTHLRAHET